MCQRHTVRYHDQHVQARNLILASTHLVVVMGMYSMRDHLAVVCGIVLLHFVYVAFCFYKCTPSIDGSVENYPLKLLFTTFPKSCWACGLFPPLVAFPSLFVKMESFGFTTFSATLFAEVFLLTTYQTVATGISLDNLGPHLRRSVGYVVSNGVTFPLYYFFSILPYIRTVW